MLLESESSLLCLGNLVMVAEGEETRPVSEQHASHESMRYAMHPSCLPFVFIVHTMYAVHDV